MHSQELLLFSFLAANVVTAIPLNINLGAYSPALVVGDGEISFGGKQDVTNLMNALEGAAVSSAANNAGQATTPANGQQSAAPATTGTAKTEGAQVVTPDEQQAAQIAALQGMGKEIAPRVVQLVENAEEVAKRDLAGFDRALNYATGALTTGPKVQLGTEAAGVGILVEPGTKATAKRDETLQPKMKTTVTTMFVRGGPVPVDAKQRSIEVAPVDKRAPSPELDGVNLNMAQGQVAELTFVETRAVGTDEDEDDE